MKLVKFPALLTSIFLLLLATAFGGKVPLSVIREYIYPYDLIVVVDVKNVTKVETTTGDNQIANVYVAEADVLETLRSDLNPTPEKRKIAIVSSIIPSNTETSKPIEKRRYLAYLISEQGHYRYSLNYDMNPISAEGKVEFLQINDKGKEELVSLDIEEALKRIRTKEESNQKNTKPKDSP